jgi:hypothetical protein
MRETVNGPRLPALRQARKSADLHWFADWDGTPFTADSQRHVSVWRKPQPARTGPPQRSGINMLRALKGDHAALPVWHWLSGRPDSCGPCSGFGTVARSGWPANRIEEFLDRGGYPGQDGDGIGQLAGHAHAVIGTCDLEHVRGNPAGDDPIPV